MKRQHCCKCQAEASRTEIAIRVATCFVKPQSSVFPQNPKQSKKLVKKTFENQKLHARYPDLPQGGVLRRPQR
eukprot:1583303-Amphidinium_carterae.1